MAFTLKFLDTSGFSSTYLDENDSFIVFAAAQKGDKGAIAQVMSLPNFVAEATVTTDTSDGEIVDLTDQGVTFPADSLRTIRCKSYCSSPNDHYMYEWEETVLGGTTPVLLGQRINYGVGDQAGTVFEYGPNLKFEATITALTTLDTIVTSKGYALSDITAGLAAFTVPRNRLFVPLGASLTAPSAVTATAARGNIAIWDPTNLDGLGTGTDGVQFLALATTTSAVVGSPALGGIVALAFECWPPINHRLVMDSNNVTIKATATNANVADDSLRHRLEIFVGPIARLVHTT